MNMSRGVDVASPCVAAGDRRRRQTKRNLLIYGSTFPSIGGRASSPRIWQVPFVAIALIPGFLPGNLNVAFRGDCDESPQNTRNEMKRGCFPFSVGLCGPGSGTGGRARAAPAGQHAAATHRGSHGASAIPTRARGSFNILKKTRAFALDVFAEANATPFMQRLSIYGSARVCAAVRRTCASVCVSKFACVSVWTPRDYPALAPPLRPEIAPEAVSGAVPRWSPAVQRAESSGSPAARVVERWPVEGAHRTTTFQAP